MIEFDRIDPARPVLIAGPTASGKSALATAIVRAQGGTIVNADALQVYTNWRVLSARPSPEEEAELPHRLYGHVAPNESYSVGHWLRDLRTLMQTGERLVIVGGTGLYFSALTEGLAEIPETPAEIRAEADRLRVSSGIASLLEGLDLATRARIDITNPRRVQRAWEVRMATGRSLVDWQNATPPPLIAVSDCTPLLVEASKPWLDPRIERRFDLMLDRGALTEARANIVMWDSARPASQAIGAKELIRHLNGEITLAEARAAAIIATRQFAKRQRTWFRARMQEWFRIKGSEI